MAGLASEAKRSPSRHLANDENNDQTQTLVQCVPFSSSSMECHKFFFFRNPPQNLIPLLQMMGKTIIFARNRTRIYSGGIRYPRTDTRQAGGGLDAGKCRGIHKTQEKSQRKWEGNNTTRDVEIFESLNHELIALTIYHAPPLPTGPPLWVQRLGGGAQ